MSTNTRKRRFQAGVVLAAFLLLGAPWAYQWFRLNGTERRLVGVWTDTSFPQMSVLTFHADGHYTQQYGHAVTLGDETRWNTTGFGSASGRWWCEGDRLLMDNDPRGGVQDVWMYVVAWWRDQAWSTPDPPKAYTLRFEPHDRVRVDDGTELVLASESFGGIRSAYPAVWRKLSDSPIEAPIRIPPPDEP